jgi:hypothetical protein
MDKINLGQWTANPKIGEFAGLLNFGAAIWKMMQTKHEGDVLYFKFWNFWVRAGTQASVDNYAFFRDYEASNTNIDKLLKAIGFPWKKADTEEEVWERIGMLWNWLGAHTVNNGAEYATLFTIPNTWPSIVDYAAYYAAHGNLVWAACFSKAHVFTTLLGRLVYPRFRFGIAEAHHTEDGAPPTATHVYTGIYVSDHWFYLDPTFVYSQSFPTYARRCSIGSFSTVDYEHPYSFLPVPLSGFDGVPYLSI